MIRIGVIIAALLALAEPALAERVEAPRFAELLGAHVKNNLARGDLVAVSRGEAITAPMVYVTVTRHKVMVYGRTIANFDKSGTFGAKQLRRCNRGNCAPRVRNKVATARARLAYKLGSVPRVLVFAAGNASYDSLLVVLRSIAEAGAALSLRLAAVDRLGHLVALPVFVWPSRRMVVDHAGRPALIRIEVSGIGGVVTATKTYSRGPQRAHNAKDMVDVLARLKLASGRNTVFVSGSPHTSVGHAITIIGRARRLFSAIILTAPGEGVYALP